MKKAYNISQIIEKYKNERREESFVLTAKEINRTRGISIKAFLSPYLFAIWFHLWQYLILLFIPIINIFPWVMLTIEGNKLAWENSKSKGPKHFELRHDSLEKAITNRYIALFFVVMVCVIINIITKGFK